MLDVLKGGLDSLIRSPPIANSHDEYMLHPDSEAIYQSQQNNSGRKALLSACACGLPRNI